MPYLLREPRVVEHPEPDERERLGHAQRRRVRLGRRGRVRELPRVVPAVRERRDRCVVSVLV